MANVKKMNSGTFLTLRSDITPCHIPPMVLFTLLYMESLRTSTHKRANAAAPHTFVVGSIAVIVPTPNGAGPWHFAVKTMLILYGVADNNALYFVLIVHTVQTLLVVALGVYAWIALSFTKKRTAAVQTN